MAEKAKGSLQVFCDGLSEPNPGGIASYGFVVSRKNGASIKEGSGVAVRGSGATNNIAEYTAAVEAMRWLLEAGYQEEAISLFSDSQLLVNQLKGEWAVKSPKIIPLYRQASRLLSSFPSCSVAWVPREHNEEADALSVASYVEAIEGERRDRARSVELKPLGEGVYEANGRYRVYPRFKHCECPDFERLRRFNASGRFYVRCKHLIAAEERDLA